MCERSERCRMDYKISIQKIAEEAGVSTATVSRVINFPEKVAEQTRMRVESIIRKYHYKPNLLAQGLRNSQMPIVGILVPDIANEFFANIVIYVQQYLFDHGFWAIICNSNQSKRMQQSYLKMLIDQNISGMIAISFDGTNFEWPRYIPTVFVDRRPIDCGGVDKLAIVESDNYQGGLLATEELIRSGCRRIAVITASDLIHIFTDRLNGYRDALQAHGISFDGALIQRMETISVAKGMEAIAKLLDAGAAFDGVFAAADIFALGALQELKNRGIGVPDSVGLVGFDDLSMTRYCHPSITSVHQYSERLAKVAVESLLSLIQHGNVDAVRDTIPVRLVRRESTKSD